MFACDKHCDASVMSKDKYGENTSTCLGSVFRGFVTTDKQGGWDLQGNS